MLTLNRPIIFYVSCFGTGLFIGGGYAEGAYPLFFATTILIVLGVIGYVLWGMKYAYIGGMMLAAGLVVIQLHPITVESKWGESLERPIVLRGRVVQVVEKEYKREVLIDTVKRDNNKRFRSRLLLQIDDTLGEIAPYDELKMQILPKAPTEAMNPIGMNYPLYLKTRGVALVGELKKYEKLGSKSHWYERGRDWLEERLDTIYQGKDYGIMKAALFGVDDDLDKEELERYSRVGIGHILVISGFNIGLVLALLIPIGRIAGLKYETRQLVYLAGIWSYTFLTGLEVSTLRATLMCTIVLVAKLLWEQDDGLTALFGSSFIILLWNPYQFYSVGFWLSYVAVGGIYYGQWICHHLLTGKKAIKEKISEAIILWVAIMVFTYPVLSYAFFEVPFIGSILNLLMVPLFSLAMIVSVFCIGISLFSISLAKWCSGCVIALLGGLHEVTQLVATQPYATICTGRLPLWIYVLYGIGIVLLAVSIQRKDRRKWIGYYGVIFVVVILCWSKIPGDYEWLSFYVGQGDGSVIITPHKKAVVIDTGSKGKERAIIQYLKYKGINEIEYLILTHPHEDHIGGAVGLLESTLRVRQIRMSSRPIGDEVFDALYQVIQDKQIPLKSMREGSKLRIEALSVTCLAPKVLEEEGNNSSIVLLTSVGKWDFLYMGDAEEEVENRLCESGQLKDIEVLKVGHHGSKTSSSEPFLLQVKPEYAIISSGKNNRYGHPHVQTLNHLTQMDTKVYQTAQLGAIRMKIDGNQLKIEPVLNRGIGDGQTSTELSVTNR